MVAKVRLTPKKESLKVGENHQLRPILVLEAGENHPLYPVLTKVIEQVTVGKGVRHGGIVTTFVSQPWSHYAAIHGRGFLTGQAAKKLEEAASCLSGEFFINEMLGAIAYAAMAILHEQDSTGE